MALNAKTASGTHFLRVTRCFRDALRVLRSFRVLLRPNRTLRLFNIRSAVLKFVMTGALQAFGCTVTIELPGNAFVPCGNGGIFIEKALLIWFTAILLYPQKFKWQQPERPFERPSASQRGIRVAMPTP